MHRLFITGSGGALGALTRYEVGRWIPSPENAIPLSTLLVNGIGSFVLACLTYTLFKNKKNERLKLFFGTGLCGGFTTMSTFALEVTNLASRNPVSGFIYLILSMTVGLGMAWLGFITVSSFRRRVG